MRSRATSRHLERTRASRGQICGVLNVDAREDGVGGAPHNMEACAGVELQSCETADARANNPIGVRSRRSVE